MRGRMADGRAAIQRGGRGGREIGKGGEGGGSPRAPTACRPRSPGRHRRGWGTARRACQPSRPRAWSAPCAASAAAGSAGAGRRAPRAPPRAAGRASTATRPRGWWPRRSSAGARPGRTARRRRSCWAPRSCRRRTPRTPHPPPRAALPAGRAGPVDGAPAQGATGKEGGQRGLPGKLSPGAVGNRNPITHWEGLKASAQFFCLPGQDWKQ